MHKLHRFNPNRAEIDAIASSLAIWFGAMVVWLAAIAKYLAPHAAAELRVLARSMLAGAARTLAVLAACAALEQLPAARQQAKRTIPRPFGGDVRWRASATRAYRRATRCVLRGWRNGDCATRLAFLRKLFNNFATLVARLKRRLTRGLRAGGLVMVRPAPILFATSAPPRAAASADTS